MINYVKCPHCGYRGDECDFPDLYCEFEEKAEYKEQYKLLKQLQDLGYNIVTCGMCGYIKILSKIKEVENERQV